MFNSKNPFLIKLQNRILTLQNWFLDAALIIHFPWARFELEHFSNVQQPTYPNLLLNCCLLILSKNGNCQNRLDLPRSCPTGQLRTLLGLWDTSSGVFGVDDMYKWALAGRWWRLASFGLVPSHRDNIFRASFADEAPAHKKLPFRVCRFLGSEYIDEWDEQGQWQIQLLTTFRFKK